MGISDGTNKIPKTITKFKLLPPVMPSKRESCVGESSLGLEIQKKESSHLYGIAKLDKI